MSNLSQKKVLVAGSTGMVGGILLEQCLKTNKTNQVVSLVRRPSGRIHPKLQEVVIKDFTNITNITGIEQLFQDVDVVYCCIGVYTGSVSKDAFKKITVDIPMSLGKSVAKHSPKAKYILLSGAGADRTEKSRMLFAKYKGIAENRLSELDFASFHTIRPGYIYPVKKRKEPNFSYRAFRLLYPLLKPLIKNTSVRSTDLVRAMLNVGLNQTNQEVFENKDILRWVRV